MAVKQGVRVDTKRRRSVYVMSDPDKWGWFQGRTLGGKVLFFSVADVTAIHR